ncbi:MAG TPA: hypothetical protein VFC44_05865 [Candidatus Saccharimonadales bacterium]|nr:hypothetical protein [Candidatus Saccharimonadales bacterium]
MEYKKKTSFTLIKTAACALLTLGLIAMAQAQDSKIDPTGTWIWSTPGRNGGADRTNTLTLKYENSALTGALQTPGRNNTTNSADISEGKLTGDQITFKITREVNGNSVTAGYEGTLTADTIKGKINTERNGQPRSRKWEAKRQAATP